MIQKLAERHRRLVVLPRGREEPRRAGFSRKLRGPRIAADDECLGVDRWLYGSQKHVRPIVASHHVDLIGLQQLFRDLPADFRLDLIVLVDHLHIEVAHLAAEMIEGEFEAVLLLIADESIGAAECVDIADLDFAALRLCAKRG